MQTELFLRPRQRQKLTDTVVGTAGQTETPDIVIGPVVRNAETKVLGVVDDDAPVEVSEQAAVQLVQHQITYERAQSAQQLNKVEQDRRINNEKWKSRIQDAWQAGRFVGSFFAGSFIGFVGPLVGAGLYAASRVIDKTKKPIALVLTTTTLTAGYTGLSTIMASEGVINLEAVKDSLIGGGLVGGAIGVMILGVFILASRQNNKSEQTIDGERVKVIDQERRNKKGGLWPKR